MAGFRKTIKTKVVQLEKISFCSFNDGHSLRCESYWFWSPHGKNEHVRVHSLSKAQLPLSIFSNCCLSSRLVSRLCAYLFDLNNDALQNTQIWLISIFSVTVHLLCEIPGQEKLHQFKYKSTVKM